MLDGQAAFDGGIDYGNLGHLIGSNQSRFAINVTFRGGVPTNRPPFDRKNINFASVTGVFQGALDRLYQADNGDAFFVFLVGGRLWRINAQTMGTPEDITPNAPVYTTADFTVPAASGSVVVPVTDIDNFTALIGQTIVLVAGEYTVSAVDGVGVSVTLVYSGTGATPGEVVGLGTQFYAGGLGMTVTHTMPANAPFAWLFQAESYAITLCEEARPFIYTGSATFRSDVADDQIPPGYIGAYISGRIWLVEPTRNTYVAGDLVGPGNKGTQANAYRDSVLWFTSNTYLAEYGVFTTPAKSGVITAVDTPATTDAALGTGPVLVGTTSNIFSCNAPVDATTWQNLSYPLQGVATFGYGPLSARNFVSVNDDFWYRSADGFRSFKIARRDFAGGWANVPKSFEVSPILDYDDPSLLWLSSGVYFDNRYLSTVSPKQTENGVVHRGLVALNFDELSRITSGSAPAYEGIWSGLHIYQIIKGMINGVERCFMFCQSQDGTATLELWELLLSGEGDSGTVTRAGQSTVFVTRIQSSIEGRTLFVSSMDVPKTLKHSEIFQREIRNTVDWKLEFRPDDYPNWTTLDTWTECSDMTSCAIACPPVVNQQPGYRPSYRTRSAPDVCMSNGRVAKFFYTLNWRLSWTGNASPWRIRFLAMPQVDPPKDACNTVCQPYSMCPDDWFSYQSAPTS